ncbi:hypothetical protein [Rhizobium binxianense]
MTLKLNQHASQRLHEAERADLSLSVRMDCAGETIADGGSSAGEGA